MGYGFITTKDTTIRKDGWLVVYTIFQCLMSIVPHSLTSMISVWVEMSHADEPLALNSSRDSPQGQIASELWFCAGIPILHSQLDGGPPTPLLSRRVLWQKLMMLEMRNLRVLSTWKDGNQDS